MSPDNLEFGKQAGLFVWFAGDTNVLVGYDENGQPITKRIEDVQVGDLVLARDQNDETGELALQEVTRVYSRQTDHLRIITYIDENGQAEVIRTTDEHPFWVEGRGWTPAGELTAGMVLGDPDGPGGGTLTVVSSIREEHPEGITVYNFELASGHTYFVEDGSDAAVWAWVHNKCQVSLAHYLGGTGGRWGSRTTRALNHQIALRLKGLGFTIVGGGGFASEELIRSARGTIRGGTWVDITAELGRRRIRVQTYTTLADGVTAPAREAAAAARIRAAFPNDLLCMIPK